MAGATKVLWTSPNITGANRVEGAVAVGLILLVWSSDRFVFGSAGLARAAGISPLVVGMVVVGFGTSAPELAVSTLAAIEIELSRPSVVVDGKGEVFAHPDEKLAVVTTGEVSSGGWRPDRCAGGTCAPRCRGCGHTTALSPRQLRARGSIASARLKPVAPWVTAPRLLEGAFLNDWQITGAERHDDICAYQVR